MRVFLAAATFEVLREKENKGKTDLGRIFNWIKRLATPTRGQEAERSRNPTHLWSLSVAITNKFETSSHRGPTLLSGVSRRFNARFTGTVSPSPFPPRDSRNKTVVKAPYLPSSNKDPLDSRIARLNFFFISFSFLFLSKLRKPLMERAPLRRVDVFAVNLHNFLRLFQLVVKIVVNLGKYLLVCAIGYIIDGRQKGKRRLVSS